MPPVFYLLGLLLMIGVGVIAFAKNESRVPSPQSQSSEVAGERLVAAWLDRLCRQDSGIRLIFHDLWIPREDGLGLTQLDHVVVSSKGIFVIDTMNREGRVSGCRYDSHWSQKVGGRERTFENPLFKNQINTKAVANYLRLPEKCCKGVVFVVGSTGSSAEIAENVVFDEHLSWLGAQRVTEVMPTEVERSVVKLEEVHRDAGSRSVGRDANFTPEADWSLAV